MTVKQMIERLQKFDPAMRVVVPAYDHNFRPPHIEREEDYPDYPAMRVEIVVVIS